MFHDHKSLRYLSFEARQNDDDYFPGFTTMSKADIEQAVGAVQAKQRLKVLNAQTLDVWTKLAAEVLKVAPEKLTDDQRKRAKKAGYAWSYGADEADLEAIFEGKPVDLSRFHPILAGLFD